MFSPHPRGICGSFLWYMKKYVGVKERIGWAKLDLIFPYIILNQLNMGCQITCDTFI